MSMKELMSMSEIKQANKIFDDYLVDCNKCESYWLGQCDGVKQNEVRNCTAYKATREVDIPEQINKLKGDLCHLQVYNMMLTVLFIIHLLFNIFGG